MWGLHNVGRNGQNSGMGTIAKSFAALRANPKLSLSGLLGLAIFIWDRVNDYLTGSGLMVAWLGADWFGKVTQSGWFTLLGLVLVLFSLWRIGVLSAKGQQLAAETEAAKQQLRSEAEMGAYQRVSRTIQRIFDIYFEERRLVEARMDLSKLESSLTQFLDVIARYEKSDEFLVRPSDENFMYRASMRGLEAQANALLKVVPFSTGEIELRHPEPHIVTHPPEGMAKATQWFDPALNRPYLAEVRSDAGKISRHVQAITGELQRKEQALKLAKHEMERDFGGG